MVKLKGTEKYSTANNIKKKAILLVLLANHWTITEISNWIKISRKTVSNTFLRYQKEGLINKDRTLTNIGIISLNKAEINKFLQELGKKGERLNKSHCRKYKNKLDLIDYIPKKEKCVVCGYDKNINLHHIDRNRNNNKKTNLVGLCFNHHQLIHLSNAKIIKNKDKLLYIFEINEW